MIKKVLCIDDDEVSCLIATMIIQDYSPSTQVDTALSGKKALTYLENTTDVPEIILLDLNMPVMDGWEFLEEYEKQYSEKFPEVKVIILSSSIDIKDEQRANENELVSMFVPKPLNTTMVEKIFAIVNK